MRQRTSGSIHHREPDEYPWPRAITVWVGTDCFEVVVVSVILVNVALNVYEADSRAQGEDVRWLEYTSLSFMVAYILEILLRIYVERLWYFYQGMNILDIIIVTLDVISLILQATSAIGEQPPITVFRVFRLLRLLRLIRTSEYFHELWLMLHGLAAAIKAMFWAAVLICVFLLIWSVIAVELLHPLVRELADQGEFPDCGTFCKDAFSTVHNSMRTWFLLIFVGEMWADLAIPLLRNTGALVILAVAYITINLGLLNLILTVIVDRASSAREHDQEQKVLEKHEECRRAKNRLLNICKDLDKDNSATLTLEELEGGFDSSLEFADAMRVMDVGKDDLKIVFEILDSDQSGTVSYDEFVEQLHMMRSKESHTLLVFVKHYVQDVHLKVTEQLDLLKNDLLVKTSALFGQYEHTEVGLKRLMSFAKKRGSPGYGDSSDLGLNPTSQEVDVPMTPSCPCLSSMTHESGASMHL